MSRVEETQHGISNFRPSDRRAGELARADFRAQFSRLFSFPSLATSFSFAICATANAHHASFITSPFVSRRPMTHEEIRFDGKYDCGGWVTGPHEFAWQILPMS